MKGPTLAMKAVTALSVLLLSVPTPAHHSVAMFDMQRPLTLTVTVKSFQFTNPHCFIQLLVTPQVPNQENLEEWSVEMGAPVELLRHGWRPASIKAGDKLTLLIAPTKDGAKGGRLMSATAADGKPIGGQ